MTAMHASGEPAVPALPDLKPIVLLDAAEVSAADVLGGGADVDPGEVVLTCANCGARMDERKCKLICSCGYFASCSDYY